MAGKKNKAQLTRYPLVQVTNLTILTHRSKALFLCHNAEEARCWQNAIVKAIAGVGLDGKNGEMRIGSK